MDKAQALQQYKKFVAENPSDRDGARKSFYDKFGMDPEAKATFSKQKGEGLTEQERTLRKRYADTQRENAAAGYKQDIADAKGQFAKDVSKAIPVAATLATGGLAAPAAAAVMGGSGLAAGLWGEGASLAVGSRDAAKSAKEFTKSLAIETVLGAGSELGVRGASALLKYGGKTVLMPMVAQAAAKTEKGMKILEEHGISQLNKLREISASSGFTTNVGKELTDLESRLALRKTGLSDATKEAMKEIASKLHRWDGSLAGLAEIKGDVSQLAFKRTGIHFEERRALKSFAEALDRKVGDGFKAIGGDAGRATYNAYKETINQVHRYSGAVELAKEGISKLASRVPYALAGGGYGAYSGYQSGGVQGAVTHAIEGGIAGAITGTALKTLQERGAPWLLERLLADKAAAPMVRQAIAKSTAGDMKGAMAIFSRAMAQTKVKDEIRPILREMAEPDAENAN